MPFLVFVSGRDRKKFVRRFQFLNFLTMIRLTKLVEKVKLLLGKKKQV